MSNPPPMAEQFLQDLRKMIAIAKQRINTRRHIPNLPIILEEDIEDNKLTTNPKSTPKTLNLSSFNPFENEKNSCLQSNQFYHKNNETTESVTDFINDNGSPKSAKSDDSGRETFNTDSETESSASTSSGLRTPPKSPQLEHLNPKNKVENGVVRLVHGFESKPSSKASTWLQTTSNKTDTMLKINSRIPISKSPRLSPKATQLSVFQQNNNSTTNSPNRNLTTKLLNNNSPTTTHSNNNIATKLFNNNTPIANRLNRSTPLHLPPVPSISPPPLPPRNISPLPPAPSPTQILPQNNKKSVQKNSTQKQQKLTPNEIKRNAFYLSTGTDSMMLKKSLPRRNKKSLTPINAIS